MKDNPILVEVHRNNVVESVHRGSVIAVNDLGETVFSIGDVDRDIYPRSSLKLFQAIPLVESGAAEKYGLSDKELALACASHNAESEHTETVKNWLRRLDLDVDDLECGAVYPGNDSAKHQLIENKQPPGRAHHNCSGKHTGMLTLAQQLGMDTRGYSEHQHPTQQAWMQTLSELVEIDVKNLVWERDGCGLPAIYMPMERLAYGCALFANTGQVGGARGQAMKNIISAIQDHPDMIAGMGCCCSEVIKATQGRVIVKTGAEAVYIAVIPELKLGVALKIDDGSSRGSEVALGAVLKKLGAIDSSCYQQLNLHFEPPIINSQNKVTGKVCPSGVWN